MRKKPPNVNYNREEFMPVGILYPPTRGGYHQATLSSTAHTAFCLVLPKRKPKVERVSRNAQVKSIADPPLVILIGVVMVVMMMVVMVVMMVVVMMVVMMMVVMMVVVVSQFNGVVGSR